MWNASRAATAISSALGSASPMSSAAIAMARRKSVMGSSPPSSMRAIQ